jgi:hypothetical protein
MTGNIVPFPQRVSCSRCQTAHDVVRHCEERSNEAIQNFTVALDCFAALAMTERKKEKREAERRQTHIQ